VPNIPLSSEPITYAEAIRLGLEKQLITDPRVLVYGLGVDDPKAMYGTLQDFPSKFGSNRCFDTPLSEDSLTGYGIGLAISGFKPIHVHQRTDFLLLCCNQLINMAAKVKYISNGRHTCPFAVRAITGRSWGQGAQHSQSFHSMFSNIPGLRVLVPSTPDEAYNTYSNLFNVDIPTVVIEHRMLYATKGVVTERTCVPGISQLSSGTDMTLVSISHMTLESQRALKYLSSLNFSCNHFSLVDTSVLQLQSVLDSAKLTGKVLLVDHGWLNSSVVHTISSYLYTHGFNGVVKILGYADSPCPTAKSLENLFYPSAQSILAGCLEMLNYDKPYVKDLGISPEILNFKGPF